MNKLKDNMQKSEMFINLITMNNDVLIQNPFGNYAVQHAFEVTIFEMLIFLLKFKYNRFMVMRDAKRLLIESC